MKKIIIFLLILLFGSFSVFADEWVSMDSRTDQDLEGIFMQSSLIGWAVGGDGIGIPGRHPVILKTSDGGDNWTEQTVPGDLDDSDTLHAVCFSDSNHGWVVGNSNYILRTINGGETWIVQESPTGAILEDVWCFDDDTAIIVGSAGHSLSEGYFGTILRTDGGGPWLSRLSGDPTWLFSIYFVGDVGYAGGNGGKVYRSIDGGLSWVERTNIIANEELGTTLSINDIFCLDEETCWVSGGGEVLYYTDDSGGSWTPYITGGAVSGLAALYFKNDLEGYAVGNSVIRYTNNSGVDWSISRADISYEFSGHLPFYMVNDVQCIDDVCWAVGDDGHILRLNEPLVATIYNPPTELELDEPEQPEYCPVFFDDCEAGWNPVPIYDIDGCIVDYECVREGQGELSISEADLNQFSSFLPDVPGISENERVNIFAGDDVIGIVLLNDKPNLVPGKELEDATYSVYMSEETFESIVNAKDPVEEVKKALKNKDMVIKGETVGSKVKIFFMKMFLIFK